MRISKRLLTLSIAGVFWLAGTVSARAAQEEPEAIDSARTSREKVFEEAVDVRGQANAELVESQDRIEKLSDATDDLLTKYQSALRQKESLDTYNRQLDSLILSQESERASLVEQIDRVELVSREITPLMLRMIDALTLFIDLDVPFLEKERSERIDDLRKLMNRANVSEAEKYRRLMEAYQVENEYGRTIEAYRSTVKKEDKELTVNFLRIGRIALLYQTLDESEAGVWNQELRRWEPLDGTHRTAIRRGLRIARKQSAPDLILLPLPLAERDDS